MVGIFHIVLRLYYLPCNTHTYMYLYLYIYIYKSLLLISPLYSTFSSTFYYVISVAKLILFKISVNYKLMESSCESPKI